MENHNYIRKVLLVLLLSSLCVVYLFCGGGGGGTQVTSVQTYEISGIVSLPSGISASKTAARLSEVDGLNKIGGATVQVFYVDAAGEQSGPTLGEAVTDAGGYYRLELDQQIQPVGNLVACVTVGTEKMRAIVYAPSPIDINPVSEMIFSDIVAGDYALTSFSTEELSNIHKTVMYDAGYFSFDTYTTIAAAVDALGAEEIGENAELIIGEIGSGTYSGSVCGNDIHEYGEECDYGSDATDTACIPSYNSSPCNYCTTECEYKTVWGEYCGDGVVQSAYGEECDDGNTTDGDECDSNCLLECGNGELDGDEECDDGNIVTETCDYNESSCTICDATCKEGAGVTIYCGDGVLDTGNGEVCDDGNTSDGDGCSSTCTCETVTCGDGNYVAECVTGGEEECDDGNTVTETCDYGETSCTVCDETCMETAGPTEYCGDGVLQSADGEECDDGNTTDNDKCSSECKVEYDNGSLGITNSCTSTLTISIDGIEQGDIAASGYDVYVLTPVVHSVEYCEGSTCGTSSQDINPNTLSTVSFSCP